MKRRTKARSKAGKSVRYKSATVKRRRTLAKTVPGRRSAMTAQDLEIARLTRERDELL
jgi:FixJ family two-component response regulator